MKPFEQRRLIQRRSGNSLAELRIFSARFERAVHHPAKEKTAAKRAVYAIAERQLLATQLLKNCSVNFV